MRLTSVGDFSDLVKWERLNGATEQAWRARGNKSAAGTGATLRECAVGNQVLAATRV